MVQTLIEANQEIDDIHPIAWDRSEKRRQQRTRRLGIEKRRKLLGELRGIGERESLRERLYEEVERIDHRHVGDQIDGDLEFAGLFREYEAREPVSVRVLQPVHEMLCRRHLERIARYASAAMRRGPQPDDLWSETDGAFVPVARGMVKTDKDRHTPPCCVVRNRVTWTRAFTSSLGRMIPASCCKAWTYYAIFNAIFGPTTALAISPPERTIRPHATKPGGVASAPAGTRGRDLRPMTRTCEGA